MRAALARRRLGGSLPPYSAGQYTGLVATRLFLPNTFAGGVFFEAMSRVYVHFTETVDSFQIGFPNYWVQAGVGETGTGADATIKMGFEYQGVTTQVLFGGSASGTIPDGSDILSDPVSRPVMANTGGWVRCHWSGAGVPYTVMGINVFANANFGDCFAFNVTVTDGTTGTGPFDSNDPLTYLLGPHLIVGKTRRPSVFLLGDSRYQGYGDAISTDQPVMGDVDRSLWKAKIATANWGISGDYAASVKTAAPQRLYRMSQFATHIVSDIGGNDINGAISTAAQCLADIAAIQSQIGQEKRWVLSTMYPVTASTDGWATTVNQSISNPTTETQRVAYNVAVRSSATGLANVLGTYDMDAVIADPANPGLYRATGTAGDWTSDGVHLTQTGTRKLRDSGIVTPALITNDRRWVKPIAGTPPAPPSDLPTQANYLTNLTLSTWTKNATTVSGSAVRETTATDQHLVAHGGITRAAGVKNMRAQIDYVAEGRAQFAIIVYDSTGSATSLGFFDTVTPTLAYTNGSTFSTPTGSITSKGGGRYRACLDFTTDASTTGMQFVFGLILSDGNGNYAGDTSKGGTVTNMYLFNRDAGPGGY